MTVRYSGGITTISTIVSATDVLNKRTLTFTLQSITAKISIWNSNKSIGIIKKLRSSSVDRGSYFGIPSPVAAFKRNADYTIRQEDTIRRHYMKCIHWQNKGMMVAAINRIFLFLRDKNTSITWERERPQASHLLNTTSTNWSFCGFRIGK